MSSLVPSSAYSNFYPNLFLSVPLFLAPHLLSVTPLIIPTPFLVPNPSPVCLCITYLSYLDSSKDPVSYTPRRCGSRPQLVSPPATSNFAVMNVTRPIAQPADSFMVLPGMKPKYTEDPRHPGETRLRGFGWLPNRIRHLFIACLGEFVGTFLFLFFAFAATQVANNLLGNKSMDIETLMYISLSFGFSLAVNVWIFFRISGGLFNPAVCTRFNLTSRFTVD